MLHRLAALIAILLAVQVQGFAQATESTKIKLLGAEVLRFDKDLGLDAQRLLGNVRFSHKGALMFCDSAYLYNRSNSLAAFGDVRVLQGDTLAMYSDKLYYDGNTQYVKVRDNVTLRDGEMSLTTHTLDYDRREQKAVFYDRGIITSSANENKLVACEGMYDSRISFFYFRDSVVLNNPDYTVETDTLNYANGSEVAYFQGPTFIYSTDNTIYCENGWYDTKQDISQFNENAWLSNGTEVLRGDSLWYDRDQGLGKAYEHVSITDTTNRVIIKGNYGRYDEHSQRSLVTGRAEMIQYEGADSLFLHGDTLLAVGDSIKGDKVYAYHRVKFYRKDLQGAADSLVFSESDSLLQLYKNPILWSENLQITGDTIQIKTYDGEVKQLFVFENSFISTQVDSVHFNQIKGRRLTGTFKNNELNKVLINGNGQSLYYALEEKKVPLATPVEARMPAAGTQSADSSAEGSTTMPAELTPDTAATTSDGYVAADSTLRIAADSGAVAYRVSSSIVGVNKAICSSIAVYLANNQVQKIMFLNQPDGSFIPLQQFSAAEAFFDGFSWEESRRPQSPEAIFQSDLALFPYGASSILLEHYQSAKAVQP